jgi:TPP-dependent pyruvate/acetoin dehydrogenase alpha subunit
MTQYTYQGKGISGVQKHLPLYEPPDLKRFYYNMLRIRRIEETIATCYTQDEMKSPIHLSIGQEAICVGASQALEPKDRVFCSHRTHGPYLAKGGDLKKMLSELHCRKNGCVGSRGGSMHLLDKASGMEGSSAIVAGIIPIATGAALALKQQRKQSVILVYFGDAATEEGASWESFNFAKLKNLPIIYICENNFYSVCSPLHARQPPETSIYKKGEAFGLKSALIDGTNVLEVHQTVKEAKERIEKGEGPVLIEAKVYRWLGHHGSEDDFHLGYRSQEEFKTWKDVDPLLLLETSLMSQNTLRSLEKQEMEHRIREEIEAAFSHALASPFPEKEDLFSHVYAGDF